MEPSERLWVYLKNKECFRQYPYQDEAGHWTIGYGHKMLPGEIGILKRVNTREAEALMRRDAFPAVDYIGNVIIAPLNQNQFDALASLAYNIGLGAFSTSTVKRMLNSKKRTGMERYELAAEAFHLFNKITIKGVKRVSNGLVLRRLEESEWFMKPVIEETK